MKNKLNFLLILAIFALPIVAYTMFKQPANNGAISIAATGQPTVMKFTSPLCMECKELDKLMRVVLPKYKNKIDFHKINVNSSSAQTHVKKYGVNVVPTLVFVDKNGRVVRKIEGCPQQKRLEKELDDLING